MSNLDQEINEHYVDAMLRRAIPNGDCLDCHYDPNSEKYCKVANNEWAHQLVYKTKKGPTNGLFVLHKCDNMRCINIEHLFLGTHKDNMDDRQVKGRTAKEGRPKALTDEECVEIIRLRNLGTPINDLAMKYFVSTRLIYRVLSGEDRSAHPFR